MIKFIGNENQISDSFTHVYDCDNDIELANSLSKVMVNSGYKLVEGTIQRGVYEKGNRSMRILFGAFCKYFKFNISVENKRINLISASSVFSGGVIGITQVRKEVNALSEKLKALN
jgi:hypothetical protein